MSERLTCDEAQVWLERARYEVLGGEEVPRLEQHLAGCAACRAWQASVGRVEAALGARAAQALETVSWARVERVLERRQQRTHLSFLFAGLGLVLMNAGLVALVGVDSLEPGDVLTGPVPELALVLGGWAVAQGLERRQRAALEAGETLEGLRRELADAVRSARLARWLVLGCGVLLLGLACWPTYPVRAHLVLAGFALVPGLGFGWLHWSLTRLVREQADLAPQGR
jgi:predicted anti-sigma-YlaC factor YlaD